MNNQLPFYLSLSTFILTIFSPEIVSAQSIIAAPDNTGTTIHHNGHTYTINGGVQTGVNLFHSFAEFGLSPGEVASFLSNPNIDNILGRVTGGNHSLIEGLIKISGGNSNLFLMNPAGIIFGTQGKLDVPGSFVATTADSIGFSSGGWFNSTGDNNYQNLVGSPNSFAFTQNFPGTIINAGNLTTSSGNNLSLIGGTIVNTGTISSLGGNVTLAAVPGENLVRISQAGMILGLEVPPEALTKVISPLDLPKLLTNSQIRNATNLGIDRNVVSGDVTIAGEIRGHKVNFAAANKVTPTPSGKELVFTRDGTISAPTVTLFPKTPEDATAYVFIDATVPDYQSFLYGGKPGTTSVVVTEKENGIAKISDTLSSVTGLEELHLLVEGSEGNFWLGNSFVNNETLRQYQQEIQGWSNSFALGADILIYSCFTALGIAGETLLRGIAAATGADVAASTNLTGNALLGGDWVLEKNIGNIEADLAFRNSVLDNYQGKLEVFTATNTAELINHLNISNSNLQNDTINLLPNTTYTINAVNNITDGNNGLPIILADGGRSLTINGKGSTLDRSSVGGSPDFRLLYVATGADVTLNDLTISNGKTSGTAFGTDAAGGGIFNQGQLILNRSTVVGNVATNKGGGVFSGNNSLLTLNQSTIASNLALNFGQGGGIYNGNNSLLTITSSTIANNSVDSNGNGGGIYNSAGTLTISDSTFSNNSAEVAGGAVFSNAGILNVTNTVIKNNSTQFLGGGFRGSNGNQMTISSSTFSNNSAKIGGAISNLKSQATITNTTIDSNTTLPNGNGGGVENDSDSRLTIIDSTISNNLANAGGGVYNHRNSTATITNTTISGNSSNGPGGGVFNSDGSTISLTNSTITNNLADVNGDDIGDGGGIFSSNSSGYIIRNSIIAGNSDLGGQGNDVFGDNLQGDGHNLIGDLIGIGSGSLGTDSDLTFTKLGISNTNQVLFSLGDYGGSTQTHALRPGSLALDAGNNSLVPGGITIDQRGVNRFMNNTVDIGAYESSGFALTIVAGSPQSTNINTTFSIPLTVQVTDKAYNSPLPLDNSIINFNLSNPGFGTFGSGTTITTNTQGQASNSLTASNLPGSYKATASLSNLATVDFNLTNNTATVNPPPLPNQVIPVNNPSLTMNSSSNLIPPPESETIPYPQPIPEAIPKVTLTCKDIEVTSLLSSSLFIWENLPDNQFLMELENLLQSCHFPYFNDNYSAISNL